jgi:hypothetical protein
MIFKPDDSPSINKHFSYKLCKLLSSLSYTTHEYEKIAEKIESNDEKMALLSVAAETNQYAAEISSQLKCLDIPYLSSAKDFDNTELLEYVHAVSTTGDKHNLSTICYENEHSLVDAYGDILDEYVPFPFLKEIIARQLKGIKLAFIKVKFFDFLQFESLRSQNSFGFQLS